jgi:ElaB/YqjD/DUF883 family membrane-anchored ribosome-binding protein
MTMEDVIETVKRSRRPAKNGGHAAAERSTEWKNLVADVEDLVKKVANVDDSEIAEMRAKVEDTLEKAKISAGAGLAAVRGRSEEVTEATDEYVRENPWQSVGIAAGVGLLIGLLLARR